MKQYLKMAGVFVHDSVEELEQHIYAGYMSKHCSEYAAHAINSHDELVENMNHYKSEAEMWEGRAVKEASAHADMIIERGELVAMNKELLEHLERCAKELASMIDRHNEHDMDDNSWMYDHQTPWEAMQLVVKAKGGAA